MLLEAYYSAKTPKQRIGRDVEYHEKSRNPLLRLFGIGRKKRCKIEYESIDVQVAYETLSRLLAEDGFLTVKLSDGRSSVDFVDSGEHVTFFVEQYFDLIYGGIYDLAAAMRILDTVFRGCSSEELRALFPQLPGELIYEY
jgi:hypothetical protein